MAGLDLVGNVGPDLAGDGASAPIRLTRDASVGVTEIHGRYYEHTKRGNVFTASLQAATALSLLNATATGLILSNPAGSGKDLAILEICIAVASAPAGIALLALAANLDPIAAKVIHTTPALIRPAYLGAGSNCVGLVDSAATLPAAPTVVRAIGGGPAATGSVSTAFIKDDVGGAIVLAPGTCVSLTALVTAISVLASITWEENPV